MKYINTTNEKNAEIIIEESDNIEFPSEKKEKKLKDNSVLNK